jgi:cellulose synthase (UDP-forming)
MGYWEASAPSLFLLLTALAVLPWVDRHNPLVRAIALAICLVLSWRYAIWRVTATLPPIDEPLDFAAGVLFTAVEVLTIVGASISMIFLCRIHNRSADVARNLPWVAAQATLPRIDVMICTYNEEEAILERTIIGALALDYPRARVWVCDDGKRSWLEAMCARHGVGYLVRADNAHAKAGNINAALARLAALPEPPDFVAILDADFVPMPAFLTRTLALMRDPTVAIVQTPQHFFNPDPIQRNLALMSVFPDEQRFFFDIVMASKDAWGAAFCCGTSSLIRFEALIGIGGFPTDSVTEDYLVSLRLRQKGFQTVYLNEVLSLGLAPEGLAEYAGQRGRWSLGFVQICMGPSGPLRPGNNLPLVDRIMLSETFLHWAAAHTFRLLGMLVPALYLLFDIQAVHADVLDAIDHTLPFFTAQIVTFFWLTRGRVLPFLADLYQMLCANEILKAVCAGLLRPRGQKFKVTAKGGDRSRRFLQWPLLRIFLVLIALTVAGIVNAFLLDPSRPLAESSGVALFWSLYNLVVLALACYVCIEEPRYRAIERFDSDETFTLRVGSEAHTRRACDISVTGLRFRGDAPAPVGQQVTLELDGLALPARIVRLTADGFAVELETSARSRTAMTRRVFSGRYSLTVARIDPIVVARTIAARLLR